VPADLAQIAYEASLRSLDKQAEVLNELRSRTGLLLAASSLAASFLGERTLDEGVLGLTALALIAFAVAVGASLYVLLPRGDVVFSLEGPTIYERFFEFADNLTEVHRRLAYDLDHFWEANNATLGRMRFWFRIAVVGLAAEVALLLASVGVTLV
jgi:hypothetical protein